MMESGELLKMVLDAEPEKRMTIEDVDRELKKMPLDQLYELRDEVEGRLRDKRKAKYRKGWKKRSRRRAGR